ncbi:adhesion G-protein coupled receptor G7-like [Asterias amurensis]|uniref:adhesion G-protein coupled receptor G7-like n=1 Tax=Asterias amurensis TaxID=7602 RepID=UPI003AB4B882
MAVSVRPLILVGTLLVCGFINLGQANQDECGCDMSCTGLGGTCEDCFGSNDSECEIVYCPEGMYRCGNFACLDEPWEGCEEVSSCLQTDTCGDRYAGNFNACPEDIFIPVTDEIDSITTYWDPPFNPNSVQFTSVIFTCLGPGRSVSCRQDGSGVFPVGITKVMYTATETGGLEIFCAFTVTVAATVLNCPKNVTTLAAPGDTRARVTWNDEDLHGGLDGESRSTNSSNNPGDLFIIGTHRVTYESNQYGRVLDCHFFVTVEGQCPVEITADDNFVVLNWPATQAGNLAWSIEICPLMTERGALGLPKGLRNCSKKGAPLYFRWESHTSESCGEPMNDITLDDVKQTQVSVGNAPEVAEFLANETLVAQQNGDKVDVDTIATILGNIVGAYSGDPQVTQSVVEAVNNVIQNSEDSQELSNDPSSSSAIVRSVEDQVSQTLQNEGDVSIVQDTLQVEAISRNRSDIRNALIIASVRDETNEDDENESGLQGSTIRTFIDASIETDVLASVQIPASGFDNTQDDDGTQLQAGFVIYATDALFQSASLQNNQDEEESLVDVAGPVLSVSLDDNTLNNLQEPLVITFKAPENATNATLNSTKCVSWDFTLEDGVGDWSSVGCDYTGAEDGSLVCKCNPVTQITEMVRPDTVARKSKRVRATNFAVLLDFSGQKLPPAAERALQLISQIGCALSIAALTITLAAYLCIRQLRTGKSRKIFIHFCVSLLLLYIVFLAGVENAVSSKVACVVVSALLHYLLLSTMMWMAVEARNMYDSTVNAMNPKDVHHYMLKACLFAWGSPLVVVGITVGVKTDDYWNEYYCSVAATLTMFLGLLVPIGLVLLHNIITFVLVMRSLLKVQEESTSEQISKRLQNAIGISVLMGLTWVFAFLAIDVATFTFQLLFCIANSLQGVVIFIMFFLRPKEVRKAVAPYFGWLFCCQTCRTASNTKTEDVGLASISGGTKVTHYENSVSGIDNPQYETPSPVYETSINPR